MTKAFPCDHPGCDKSFSRKDHLKRHKVNHTELYRYQCSVCLMKFKRADVKKEHYDKHFIPNGFKRKKPLKPVAPPQRTFGSLEAQTPDLNWLLGDISSDNQTQLINPSIFENEANTMLMDLLGSDMKHINTMLINATSVSQELLDVYASLIPELANHPDFLIPTLELCLSVYWELFHIQFPILHKPLFNTLSAPPILTLAMILMGATLSQASETTTLIDPIGLALIAGTELRWLIFRQRMPGTSEAWELQSLLILEVYEKHYANRDLHERSSVHQAAKIEMMKRSTLLGGDPYANDRLSSADLKHTESVTLLNKWVAAESMKRCLLMSFIFDLTSSIISSHNSLLFLDKLRLPLPCDDIIWEADLNSLKNIPSPEKPPTIRNCFNRLLQGESFEIGSFGKRVLFHTLTSMILQLEQKDDIMSLFNGRKADILNDEWRVKAAYALDLWMFNVAHQSCCVIDNLLTDIRVRDHPNTKYFGLNEPKCKLPIYHMTHIRLHIVNHDLLVYAGVPARMNVVANKADFHNVEKRMIEWAKSINGRIGVIHAYICLYECLLSADEQSIDYRPKDDPIPERAHVIVDSCLTIWGFNYVAFGPESPVIGHPKEVGFKYLRRIKKLFERIIVYSDPRLYYLSIKQLATSLESIENLHHVAGLMKVMHEIYSECSWGLGKEYSRLFDSCKERSMGRKEVFCLNMYDGF